MRKKYKSQETECYRNANGSSEDDIKSFRFLGGVSDAGEGLKYE